MDQGMKHSYGNINPAAENPAIRTQRSTSTSPDLELTQRDDVESLAYSDLPVWMVMMDEEHRWNPSTDTQEKRVQTRWRRRRNRGTKCSPVDWSPSSASVPSPSLQSPSYGRWTTAGCSDPYLLYLLSSGVSCYSSPLSSVYCYSFCCLCWSGVGCNVCPKSQCLLRGLSVEVVATVATVVVFYT